MLYGDALSKWSAAWARRPSSRLALAWDDLSPAGWGARARKAAPSLSSRRSPAQLHTGRVAGCECDARAFERDLNSEKLLVRWSVDTMLNFPKHGSADTGFGREAVAWPTEKRARGRYLSARDHISPLGCSVRMSSPSH